MPTVTLTTETRAGMGVSRDDLVPVLTLRARDSVAALLVSRGFEVGPSHSRGRTRQRGRLRVHAVVWPAPVGDAE
jgi:hypothetical protein